MSVSEVLLRLGLTFLASALIGCERESHGRAAGLRTTVLAGIAAAAAMCLSESLYDASTGNAWRPDPTRLAAGILTGMGFLGAGAIIKEGVAVRGVTTAATLWSVSILGLAFGSGHIVIALVFWALLVLVLFALPWFESLVKNDWYGWVEVRCALDGVSDDTIRERLEHLGLRVKRVALDYDLAHGERRMRFELKFKQAPLHQLAHQVLEELRGLPGVTSLRWE
ncbi:MAG: MgtC/SapB family protein [Planctomycetes bacterium]|nr:MgtC/SapB family protein [Planctomycetota bacterium]